MNAEPKVIAVFGATGAQGAGVLAALEGQDGFTARALTRDASRAAPGADEVREADLTKPATLVPALEGAYGVFLNTNSFGGPDVNEGAQVAAAVAAAKAAGVRHFVWSSLPDVARISGGAQTVPHFTNKAEANAAVTAADFEFHTFVEPPFYFQNLTSPLYEPRPGPTGSPSWFLPMDPSSRTIHMGDISQLGNVAVGALVSPEATGQGHTLSLAGELLSWDDVIATLRGQGHDISYVRVDADEWDSTSPWAPGIREMFDYFEGHTYMGPDADAKIAAARAVSTAPFTNFADWARVNMPVG